MTNTIPQAQWDYLQDRVNQMKVRDKAVKKLFYSGVARGLGGAVAGVGGAVVADYAIDYFLRNPDDEHQDITSVPATVLIGSENIWVPADYESEPFTPPVPPPAPPPWKANDFNELLNWLSDDKNDAMRKNFVDKIADDLISAYEDSVKEVLEEEGFENVQKPDFSGMKDNLKNSGMLGAVPAVASGARSPQTPGGQKAQDKADIAKREEEKINVEKDKLEEQKKTNTISQDNNAKLNDIGGKLDRLGDLLDLANIGVTILNALCIPIKLCDESLNALKASNEELFTKFFTAKIDNTLQQENLKNISESIKEIRLISDGLSSDYEGEEV